MFDALNIAAKIAIILKQKKPPERAAFLF